MPPDSDWHRLHPLSPLLRAGRFALLAALVLADDLAAAFDLGPRSAGLFLLGALANGGFAGWWSWSTTAYHVTPDEVELRTGMIFRRHRRVPVKRLESIDLARPFFARLFGLVQLRLEAVSEGDSEVRLSYLAEATALAVRDRLRQARDGLAAAEEAGRPAEAAPVFVVPTRELVLASVVARVAGVWPVLLVVTVVILVTAGAGPAAAFGLGAAPLALIVLTVGLAEAERLYGFTLGESGRGLEIRRGLLNQLHQVVPLDRVQAVAVIEPFLWRPFGRVRLVVDVAGYRGGNQQDRQQSSVLLPVAPLVQAYAVLGRVFPALRLDGLAPSPVPPAAKWRAPVRWRTLSVTWDDGHAVTRHGLLRRHTEVVPHAKVQSLRVTQGPWQRALDLATLHLDTAGTQVKVRAPHRAKDDAEQLAWASRARAGRAT